MPVARYHAVIIGSPAAARRITHEGEWSLNESATAKAPGEAKVISRDVAVEGDDQLQSHIELFDAELSRQGLKPAGSIVAPVPGDSAAWATRPIQAQMLAESLDPSGLAEIIKAITEGTGTARGTEITTSPNGTPDSPPEAKKDEKEAAKADGEAGAAATSDCCEAATIAAATPAFADPSGIWAWAEKGERGKTARELLPKLYEDRSSFTRRAEWLLSPEDVLLDRCAECDQEKLAEELLRTRAKLTESDDEQRKLRVALLGKRVELAGKEVELAGTGVSLAGEMFEHMKKWRKIADWGLGFLCVTTIFSMLAAAYVLLKLMPDKDVSDVAAPIIIFVLALFAISPAVLLLRERPLEGLDKWSPGGGGEEQTPEKDGPGGSSNSEGGTPTPATG